MKILIGFISFAVILVACSKENGALKVSEVVKGGCALSKAAPLKNVQISDVDKVTYTFSSNNLDLFVGFNATCCSTYSTDPMVKGDSIIVKITASQLGTCNCICYYTYNFKFEGTGDNYKYKITVDNYLNFGGTIKH
jgi:hypothetical protein